MEQSILIIFRINHSCNSDRQSIMPLQILINSKMTYHVMRISLVFVFLLIPIGDTAYDFLYAQSQETRPSVWNRKEFTGDWGGVRSRLDEKGFTLEINFAGDLMRNVAGGIEQGTAFLENIDFKLLIHTETLIGWSGSDILVSGLQNNGKSISSYVGDVEGVDNIEAQRTIRLYEAWLQQKLWANRISLLAGLYDVNSEFDFMESASLFIQSSQGMGGDFAGSGLIGPPIFPAAGLGFRMKFIPGRRLYFQTGIFDGSPGTLNSVKRPDLKLNDSGGSLVVAELGLLSFESNRHQLHEGLPTRHQRSHIGREVAPNYQTKIAIGAWSYSKNYVEQRYVVISTAINENRRDKGIYILADWKWNPNANKMYQQLSIFSRVGIADNEVSRFKSYFGGGVTFQGLIPGDQNGLIGFSVASTQDSKLYRRIHGDGHSSETALEWSYLTQVISWLNVQPDLQYVISPGAEPNIDNAWVLGLRVDVTL